MTYALSANWDGASLRQVDDTMPAAKPPTPAMTGPLPQYPNDAAARTGGLADWQFYISASGIQQLQGLSS